MTKHNFKEGISSAIEWWSALIAYKWQLAPVVSKYVLNSGDEEIDTKNFLKIIDEKNCRELHWIIPTAWENTLAVKDDPLIQDFELAKNILAGLQHNLWRIPGGEKKPEDSPPPNMHSITNKEVWWNTFYRFRPEISHLIGTYRIIKPHQMYLWYMAMQERHYTYLLHNMGLLLESLPESTTIDNNLGVEFIFSFGETKQAIIGLTQNKCYKPTGLSTKTDEVIRRMESEHIEGRSPLTEKEKQGLREGHNNKNE